MPTLDERIAFAEKYIRNKHGTSFSLEGRDWVRDEFWHPCDGWKLWPHDINNLCEDCAEKSGTIVEWSWALADKLKRHRKCAGLKLEPVLMTLLNLPRQSGKTFNSAAFNLTTGCLTRRRFITFMAGSEDQTKTLLKENYEVAIDQSPYLQKRAKVVGNSVRFLKTNSRLECVPTAATVTGRGRSHIVIDEARDVPADVAMRLIPSVFAQHGLECPRGHMHVPSASKQTKCPQCAARLVPWHGRIIIMSSSGVLTDTSRDWFAETLEHVESTPDPNVHMYRATETINPDIHEGSRDMMTRVFGPLASTQTFVDVEVNNTFRRQGEDFVSAHHIDACTFDLPNLPGTDRECFGFLDTSRVADLTSLVIVSDSPASVEPWDVIQVDHVKTWNPKKLKDSRIDPTAVQAYLDRHIPLFPRLREVGVDVRGGMAWAKDLVEFCNKHRPGWGRKIKAYDCTRRDERDTAWLQLEARLMAGKLRLPKHDDLRTELLAVRRVTRVNGTVEIRDRNRKVRHADIADGLAQVCRMIYKAQIGRVTMAEANRGRSVSGLLSGFRPHTAGFGEGSF